MSNFQCEKQVTFPTEIHICVREDLLQMQLEKTLQINITLHCGRILHEKKHFNFVLYVLNIL